MNIRRKLDDYLSVTSSIGYLVGPLLYPSNSVKCVSADNGHRFTKDALTLLENLDIEHPVGQYVYDVCHSFVEQYGTGGDQLLYFISSWTKAAQLLSDMGIPSSVVVHLLGTVVEGCIEHTETLQITVTDALDTNPERKDVEILTEPQSPHVTREKQIKADVVGDYDSVSCDNSRSRQADVGTLQHTEERHANRGTSLDEVTKCKVEAMEHIGEWGSGLEETSQESVNETVAETNRSGSVGESLNNVSYKLQQDRDTFFLPNIEHLNSSEHSCITDGIMKSYHGELSDGSMLQRQIHASTESHANEDIISQSKRTSDRHSDQNEITSDRTLDDKEFIDGIKIIQLKMDNADGSVKDIEQQEDISWFFKSDDGVASNIENGQMGDKENHRESSGEITSIPEKQNNSNTQQNSTTNHDAETNLGQNSCKDITGASTKGHLTLKGENTESGNSFECSESDDVHSCYDIKNELTALKSYIEMDIKRIKQGQRKLEKVTRHITDSSDAQFDACFNNPDDEFDSCFDNAIPVKRMNSTLVNLSCDGNSPDDEFKTICLTFEKEIVKNLNGFDVGTPDKAVYEEMGTEFKLNKDNRPKIYPSVQSKKWCKLHQVIDNCTTVTLAVSDDDFAQSDDDFENALEERNELKPERARHNVSKQDSANKDTSISEPTITTNVQEDTAKVDQGFSKQSKTKTKLQGIDDILKSLGKETKSSSYSSKSVKISSRHLTDMKNEDKYEECPDAKTVSAVPASASKEDCTTKDKSTTRPPTSPKLLDINSLLQSLGKDIKGSPFSAKSVKIASRHLSDEVIKDNGKCHKPAVNSELTVHTNSMESESIDSISINHNQTEIKPQVLSDEKSVEDAANSKTLERVSSTSHKVCSSSDSLGTKKLDELLKGLNGIQGVKYLKEDKPKFKSDVFVRSRHFARDTGTENSHREDVDIEVSNHGIEFDKLDESGRRERILQLVIDLNYGTDDRLVSVVTDVVVKQSTDRTLSLLPQYIQTYTMTGGQSDPVLVDGVVLKTSHAQTEAVHKLSGQICRLLIVNADITSTYKHKGYKPMKTTRVYTANTFADHVTRKDKWTLDVTDILQTLSLDVVLARGSISEDFLHLCADLGVVAMEFVPYKQLSLISDAAKITMVTYITLATEDHVCQNVHISPWIRESGEETKKCVSGSCQHASIIRITGTNPQTVVLQNHTQVLVSLEEEALLHCLHRTGSTLHSGMILPGAGHTEMACARICLDMKDKLLKESLEPGHEDGQYLATAYEVLAGSFQEYSRLVQHHFTLVQDRSLDCVYDDYRSKVQAWRTALDTVCTIMSSDFYIVTGLREEQRIPNEFVIL